MVVLEKKNKQTNLIAPKKPLLALLLRYLERVHGGGVVVGRERDAGVLLHFGKLGLHAPLKQLVVVEIGV